MKRNVERRETSTDFGKTKGLTFNCSEQQNNLERHRRTMATTWEISSFVLTKRSDQPLSFAVRNCFTCQSGKFSQQKRGFDSPHPLFDLVKLSLDYPASSV